VNIPDDINPIRDKVQDESPNARRQNIDAAPDRRVQ
jgi:hypothetical protein